MTGAARTITSRPEPAWWRKRPAVVKGIPWTGANREDVRAFAVAPDGAECSRWSGTALELWNDQEEAWLPCPVGHVAMRGVLGEFYPVSQAALAQAFVPAGETGDPLEQAQQALAAARELTDAAVAELGVLADSVNALTRAAAETERNRADAAEAKLELVRAHAESWTADDGQGPPTKEMLTEADCGRTVLNLIGETGNA